MGIVIEFFPNLVDGRAEYPGAKRVSYEIIILGCLYVIFTFLNTTL